MFKKEAQHLIQLHTLVGLLICFGFVWARYTYIQKTKQRLYNRVYDGLTIEFTDPFFVEYGDTIELQQLVKQHTGQLTIEGRIDSQVIDSYEVVFTLKGHEQRFDQDVMKQYEMLVPVRDTHLPQIEFEQEHVVVNVNRSYDIHQNIIGVHDDIDGDLALADQLGLCQYVVHSDFDTSQVGEYEVYVEAKDCNGNQANASYSIEVVRPRVAVNTEGNFQIIYQYLTQTMGFNKAAASGILANLYTESKFNPQSGSTYFGIVQWGGGRLQNLMSFTAANGLAYDSLEGQLAYLNHELSGSYASVKAHLSNVEDSVNGAMQAAIIFMREYERASHLGNRDVLAAGYYDSI